MTSERHGLPLLRSSEPTTRMLRVSSREVGLALAEGCLAGTGVSVGVGRLASVMSVGEGEGSVATLGEGEGRISVVAVGGGGDFWEGEGVRAEISALLLPSVASVSVTMVGEIMGCTSADAGTLMRMGVRWGAVVEGSVGVGTALGRGVGLGGGVGLGEGGAMAGVSPGMVMGALAGVTRISGIKKVSCAGRTQPARRSKAIMREEMCISFRMGSQGEEGEKTERSKGVRGSARGRYQGCSPKGPLRECEGELRERKVLPVSLQLGHAHAGSKEREVP